MWKNGQPSWTCRTLEEKNLPYKAIPDANSVEGRRRKMNSSSWKEKKKDQKQLFWVIVIDPRPDSKKEKKEKTKEKKKRLTEPCMIDWCLFIS